MKAWAHVMIGWLVGAAYGIDIIDNAWVRGVRA